MCYSVIDLESEILEMGTICRCGAAVSVDVLLWRITQILTDVRIGTRLRNRKISSAIYGIEQVIEHLPETKNKINLEIIIRDKKEEMKTYESHIENTALLI